MSEIAQDNQVVETDDQLKLRLFVSRSLFPAIHAFIYPPSLPEDDAYAVRASRYAALPASALQIPDEVRSLWPICSKR